MFRILIALAVHLLTIQFGYAQSARQQPPPAFQAAATAFDRYPESIRYELQALLITVGYSDAITTEKLTVRLFDSITAFQKDNGFTRDGIINATQYAKLREKSDPILARWSFERVWHPRTGSTLWIPRGLVTNRSDQNGDVVYSGPGIRIAHMAFPNGDPKGAFDVALEFANKQQERILYSLVRKDFAVLATSLPAREAYTRFDARGDGVVGFTLQWQPSAIPDGPSIAVMMSDLARHNRPPPVPRVAPAAQRVPQPSSDISPSAPPVASPSRPSPSGRQSRAGSSGTGFFVSAEGYLLTNSHVVSGCKGLEIVSGTKPPARSRIVAEDEVNDLALLQTEAQPAAIASFRTAPKIGENIFVFGFPLAAILSSTGNFTSGNITATAGLLDDTRMLQISAPVQGGNSGGPLLDNAGQVVGVVVSKLDALKFAAVAKDIPQNINFAIKTNVALGFLEAKGINVQTTNSLEKLEPSVIAQKARDFTVLVSCLE